MSTTSCPVACINASATTAPASDCRARCREIPGSAARSRTDSLASRGIHFSRSLRAQLPCHVSTWAPGTGEPGQLLEDLRAADRASALIARENRLDALAHLFPHVLHGQPGPRQSPCPQRQRHRAPRARRHRPPPARPCRHRRPAPPAVRRQSRTSAVPPRTTAALFLAGQHFQLDAGALAHLAHHLVGVGRVTHAGGREGQERHIARPPCARPAPRRTTTRCRAGLIAPSASSSRSSRSRTLWDTSGRIRSRSTTTRCALKHPTSRTPTVIRHLFLVR